MDHDLKTLLTSISLCATLFTMLAACLCCRKKVPKNEFLGLEGKVKIKNPEENACNTDASPQVEKTLTNGAAPDIDTKRVSGAPNRSLPDIPVVETTADNVYDFYASVEENKVQPKPQGRLSLQTAKTQSSVSQHSSISQADDISSPYARVRLEEHPYAQLNNVAPSPSINRSSAENSPSISTSRRGSNQSLLGGLENQPEIPAASAIAGMVSASQELPYMTPPIIQQQSHFSGDSQDSAKGYTSISVREPLANILAQTVYPSLRTVQKEICDSHYATVSDDSDEMYAAIEDPTNVADTYTSGSETYAQIQPTNAITVSVEINTTNVYNTEKQDDARATASNNQTHDTPVLPSVDTLKAQMHSRQASSSSNTSSVGILGSPKPEKRQANSPLPPTPKNLQHSSNCNLNSISSSHSDRNSITSVKECAGSNVVNSGFLLKDNVGLEADASSSSTKNFSPSKDVEGMYAKVMKKNKLSNTSSSQNSSPVLNRKSEENKILEVSYSEIPTKVVQKSPVKNKLVNAINDDNYETLGKSRARKTSYETKDHGYETIPGDKTNSAKVSSYLSRSDGYAQIKQNENSNEREVKLSGNKSDTIYGEISKIKNDTSEQGYESLSDQSAKDAGYEILKSGNSEVKKPVSDYDPNYETLRSANYSDSEQGRDDADGYSKVKPPQHIKVDYNDIQNNVDSIFDIENHDYASIVEANGALSCHENLNCSDNDENKYDIYSSLKAEGTNLYLEINKDSIENHGYQTINKLPTDDTISTTKATTASNSISLSPSPSSNRYFSSTSTETPNFKMQMKGSSTSNTLNSDRQLSNNCESLTGSESDPNYESVKYIDLENPYERLHSEANTSPETPECSASIPSTKNVLESDLSHKSVNTVVHTTNGEVDDYFQV